ncbi:hypothetical protein ACIPRU_12790 [Streptomyces sp. NPDC090126]|uniref:hypothetical protein n=1 Tax=Streptomyces sp. NPDC090126 TaxID=3365952 RepID=UPI003816E4F4
MSDNFPPPPPEQPQPEPEHRAPAQPSPWAAPAGPPRKQRTGLIVTLAVVGGLVVAGAVVTLVYNVMDAVEDSIALPPRSRAPYSEPYDGEPYEEEPYEAGPGGLSPEAGVEKDVTITACTRNPRTGWQSAKVKVVNGSSTTSSYTIMLEFLDAEGVKVAEGGAGVVALEPGGTAVRKAQGLGEVPQGTTCRISDIWRTPSESAD